MKEKGQKILKDFRFGFLINASRPKFPVIADKLFNPVLWRVTILRIPTPTIDTGAILCFPIGLCIHSTNNI